MEEIVMNCRKALIGIGIGLAAAYIFRDQLKPAYITSEKALTVVKNAFKEKGPINGSWIYTVRESYTDSGETYSIYKAGITRTADSEFEQYEAFVDAKSGNILHVEQIA
jgi:predicted small secreted protein